MSKVLKTAVLSSVLSLTATLALSVTMATPAFAAKKQRQQQGASVVPEFKRAATAIPSALLAKGYTSFDRLDLSEFSAQTQQANVTEISDLHRMQMAGDQEMERSSAQWSRDPQNPGIQVNKKMWSTTNPEVKKVLALHENLGLAGYNDDDYSISTQMWFLTQPDTDKMQSGEHDVIVRNLNTSVGGGITGVGGGGDEYGAVVKMRMALGALHDLLGSSGETRNDKIQFLAAVFYEKSEIRRNSHLQLGADGIYHAVSN